MNIVLYQLSTLLSMSILEKGLKDRKIPSAKTVILRQRSRKAAKKPITSQATPTCSALDLYSVREREVAPEGGKRRWSF